MPRAASFLALILDRAAPLSEIDVLQAWPPLRKSLVHSIPHIVNVAERTKLAINCHGESCREFSSLRSF
jgi:hypothetical protein